VKGRGTTAKSSHDTRHIRHGQQGTCRKSLWGRFKGKKKMPAKFPQTLKKREREGGRILDRSFFGTGRIKTDTNLEEKGSVQDREPLGGEKINSRQAKKKARKKRKPSRGKESPQERTHPLNIQPQQRKRKRKRRKAWGKEK